MSRVSVSRGWGLRFAALIAVGASARANGVERYDADIPSSHVTVEGTSTLHHWMVEGKSVGGFLIVHENELASLWTISGPRSQPLTPTVRVEIPVASLTSGERGMDEQMHEALKARTHPMITYRLESATITTRQTDRGDDSGGGLPIDTHGVLLVAGAARAIDIPMQVKRLSHDRLQISGDTSFRMTDFGIDPPTAMLGMIRTGDMVHVHWTWVLARGRIDNREEPGP